MRYFAVVVFLSVWTPVIYSQGFFSSLDANGDTVVCMRLDRAYRLESELSHYQSLKASTPKRIELFYRMDTLLVESTLLNEMKAEKIRLLEERNYNLRAQSIVYRDQVEYYKTVIDLNFKAVKSLEQQNSKIKKRAFWHYALGALVGGGVVLALL